MPAQSCVHAYIHPPLLLCPLHFFPCWDRNDPPAPLLPFQLTPPLADPNLDGGDAATPKMPNSASSLSGGASEVVAAVVEEDALFTVVTKLMAASAAANGAEAVTSA